MTPGPADTEFDPEELSPHLLSVSPPATHKLQFAVEAAPWLGWLLEQQGSHDSEHIPCPARTHVTPCPGQLAAHTALVTFTWVSSRGQGIGLNQLCKGSSAALPFLHFFVH